MPEMSPSRKRGSPPKSRSQNNMSGNQPARTLSRAEEKRVESARDNILGITAILENSSGLPQPAVDAILLNVSGKDELVQLPDLDTLRATSSDFKAFDKAARAFLRTKAGFQFHASLFSKNVNAAITQKVNDLRQEVTKYQRSTRENIFKYFTSVMNSMVKQLKQYNLYPDAENVATVIIRMITIAGSSLLTLFAGIAMMYVWPATIFRDQLRKAITDFIKVLGGELTDDPVNLWGEVLQSYWALVLAVIMALYTIDKKQITAAVVSIMVVVLVFMTLYTLSPTFKARADKFGAAAMAVVDAFTNFLWFVGGHLKKFLGLGFTALLEYKTRVFSWLFRVLCSGFHNKSNRRRRRRRGGGDDDDDDNDDNDDDGGGDNDVLENMRQSICKKYGSNNDDDYYDGPRPRPRRQRPRRGRQVSPKKSQGRQVSPKKEQDTSWVYKGLNWAATLSTITYVIYDPIGKLAINILLGGKVV